MACRRVNITRYAGHHEYGGIRSKIEFRVGSSMSSKKTQAGAIALRMVERI
jgi:hypothetical protein